VPLLERVKFLASQLEPGRVFQGACGGAEAPHPRGRSDAGPDGLNTAQTTKAVAARVRELVDAQHPLLSRGIQPLCSPPRGSTCSVPGDQRRARALPRGVSAARCSRPDRAGRRPRPSLPPTSVAARRASWSPSGRRRLPALPGGARLRDPCPEPDPPALRRAADPAGKHVFHAAQDVIRPAPAEPLNARRTVEPYHPGHALTQIYTRGAAPKNLLARSKMGVRERPSARPCGYSTTRISHPTILATLLDRAGALAEDLWEGEGFTAFSDLFQLYAALDLPGSKDRPLPPQPVRVRERPRYLDRDPRATFSCTIPTTPSTRSPASCATAAVDPRCSPSR